MGTFIKNEFEEDAVLERHSPTEHLKSAQRTQILNDTITYRRKGGGIEICKPGESLMSNLSSFKRGVTKVEQ